MTISSSSRSVGGDAAIVAAASMQLFGFFLMFACVVMRASAMHRIKMWL
jgi:hypothetical protein